MFTPEDLNFFIAQGSAWATQMRGDLYPKGHALADPLIRRFAPFFAGDTLARVRVVLLKEIPNPPFYSVLVARGHRIPLDFRQMARITFIDTILISEEKAELSETALTSLLFHEAVHVVQYEILGVDRFMHQYVMGWAANGFEYRNIPLERQAYALQHRFVENPSVQFSVHEQLCASDR